MCRPDIQREGDRRECVNYIEISILSKPGKIYEIILISRVIEGTKEQVAEGQILFEFGRGCIDQIFVLKQLVEKYRKKRKEVRVLLYCTITDLTIC